jgi:DNA transformation protein and related proteins
MNRPVSALPNLGPRSEAAFAHAGIGSAEELQALGADEAYRRLLESGVRPHFMGYCAVALGVEGRGWSAFDPAEKAGLRRRFDAIKRAALAARPADAALEAALDRIGVRAAQPTSSRPEKK